MAIHIFYRTASFAVFMLFLKMGRSDISVAPNNSEAKIGGSTYFNCSTSVTSEEIHWFHYPIGNQDRSFVFGFGQFYTRYIGRFAMENNATTGGYNLVITSVVAEDAGKYECQDEAGRGKKQSGQLIVLATELACQSNVDVDKVIGPNACGIKLDQLILSCVVQFRGNEAPILQWRLNDSKTITNDVTPRINGSSVVYSLAIRNDQISNGSVYVCETTRSTTKISCESGKVKVVGSTGTPGATDGDSSCAGQTNAIICLVVLFILSLSIIVILIILILKSELRENIRDRFLRTTESTKQSRKNNEENDAKYQTIDATAEEATNFTSEEDEKDEEAAQAHEQLLNQTEKPSDVTQTKNKNPQEEIDALLKNINEHKETIKRLKGENDLNEKTVKSQKLENEQLKAENEQLKVENEQLKDLEQHLYPKEIIDYADKPVLAYTIQLSGKYNGIKGTAVLGNELFVVTEGSKALAVYDSTTFHHEGNIMVTDLAEPLDIASSRACNCLFIIDKVKVEESEVSESKKVEESEVSKSKIMRLDSKGNVLAHWSIDGGTGRLSSYESNIILCLFEKQLIIEYSSIGQIILTVRLSPAAKLNHPLHAIKVTSTHFMVSHGDDKDDLHRVCVVDLDGNIKKEFTEWEKSSLRSPKKMKVPICLAEYSERSIIVADRNMSRVLLLSSQLKYQRQLINLASEDHPLRLCFDDTQSKLFVAVNKWSSKQKKWKDGRILIYNVK